MEFLDFLRHLPKALKVFFISMLPIIELRGGIPFGALPPYEQINPMLCYSASVIGNLIPIPFILIFIKKILEYMSKSNIKFFRKVSIKLINKANKRSAKFNRNSFYALFLFVAIPLPGTGAWTGALIASLIGIRFKRSMLAITLGVLVAGLIMTLGMYGIVSAFKIFA